MIGEMLTLWRSVNRYSIRQLSKVVGVDKSVLFRVEHGKNIDAKNMLKLINWMFGVK